MNHGKARGYSEIQKNMFKRSRIHRKHRTRSDYSFSSLFVITERGNFVIQ